LPPCPPPVELAGGDRFEHPAAGADYQFRGLLRLRELDETAVRPPFGKVLATKAAVEIYMIADETISLAALIEARRVIM